ncbi:hypothetical protein HYPGJ_31025 [Hyphomicrobium sp. GJ21]|nr:hypothetical protein HYPGJ_31025 [Hyphomicrobium sp. GJ21]
MVVEARFSEHSDASYPDSELVIKLPLAS